MPKATFITAIGVISGIVGLFTFVTGWADISTACAGILERVGLSSVGTSQEQRFETNPGRPKLLAMKEAERRILFYSVEGVYRADNVLRDRMIDQRGESTKVNKVEVRSLDSGDDPNFLRVQVSFTFYWVGHMTYVPLRGTGIGTVIDDGKVEFSFVDDQGRKGKGLISGDPSTRRFIVRMDTTELATGKSLSDQFRQIYNQDHQVSKMQ